MPIISCPICWIVLNACHIMFYLFYSVICLSSCFIYSIVCLIGYQPLVFIYYIVLNSYHRTLYVFQCQISILRFIFLIELDFFHHFLYLVFIYPSLRCLSPCFIFQVLFILQC